LQEAVSEVLPDDVDEHAVRAATPVMAVKAAPARRMRRATLLMSSSQIDTPGKWISGWLELEHHIFKLPATPPKQQIDW
jgi:hypothetical protein